jgi:hypothetical protein
MVANLFGGSLVPYGRKHKDIAPLIFAISKRKTWKVNQALEDNVWVGKVTLGEIFSLKHLTQFMELWAALQNVQLQASTEDRITWKPTAKKKYTAKLAYEVQFLGSIVSNLHKTMWKAWLPKFNSSLIYLHKIEFRRRTVYKSVGGQTAAFVPFASKRRRRFLTFSSIAATPPVFGNPSSFG